MRTDNNDDNYLLSGSDIDNAVSKRLNRYEGLSFFEQYAMYMGVSQLLELELKRLLIN